MIITSFIRIVFCFIVSIFLSQYFDISITQSLVASILSTIANVRTYNGSLIILSCYFLGYILGKSVSDFISGDIFYDFYPNFLTIVLICIPLYFSMLDLFLGILIKSTLVLALGFDINIQLQLVSSIIGCLAFFISKYIFPSQSKDIVISKFDEIYYLHKKIFTRILDSSTLNLNDLKLDIDIMYDMIDKLKFDVYRYEQGEITYVKNIINYFYSLYVCYKSFRKSNLTSEIFIKTIIRKIDIIDLLIIKEIKNFLE